MNPYTPDVSSYELPLNDLLRGYPSISFGTGVGHEILIGFYLVFFAVYMVVSFALFYHWLEYGMGNRYILLAEASFTVVSTFLFWVAYSIVTTL